MACSCCQPSTDPVLAAFTIILARLDALEATVATAAEQITVLNDKLTAQATVITDIAADVQALLDAVAVLQAERENLTPAGQAALDQANASADAVTAALQSLDTEVGDQDGSDTPPTP
jgi:uncharacterized coiled-coil protein SlyX